MATALHLLSMDRFEFSLQLADSVPHFPALDLVKGLADPSPATSPTFSLFGPRHALAGREVLEPCQLHLKLRKAKVPRAPRERVGGQRAKRDRKSTRLNSSHVARSYAVLCL